MRRKVRATQYIPEGPPAAFEVIDPASTRTEWHFTIRDAIVGDEPEFVVPRVAGSKKAARLVTLDEVCRAAFRECTEGRGRIHLTEWRKGLPVYQALVLCTPGWTVGPLRRGVPSAAVPMFKPLWSTDPERTARELPYHEPPARFIHPYHKSLGV